MNESSGLSEKQFESLPKIYAIDFDGWLVKSKFPEILRPRTWNVLRVKRWKKKGIKLILWTSRTGSELATAIRYTREVLNLRFDSINVNILEVRHLTKQDTRKVYADRYYDDKSFR